MKKLILLTLMVAALWSCKKDEPDLIKLSIIEKTLNHDDEYQIEAESRSPITYTIENEYHGKVSETGLVTARFVGQTDITLTNVEDTKSFKLIVAPTINLYPEPDVNYGMTKNEIITKFGTPYGTTSAVIGYDNYSSKAPQLLFLFDENDKLMAYSLYVKIAYVSDLLSFLEERYLLIDVNTKEYTTAFINGLTRETATLAIGTELYDLSYYMVIYIFMENLNKSATINTQTSVIDKLKESANVLFF